MLERWKTKNSKKTPLLQSSRESQVKKRGCISTRGRIVQCKCTCTKQVEKCVVGGPQKQVVKLLSNKEIKQEIEGGKQKIKKEYTNWFQPNLWPPIMDVIKKYSNDSLALHFFKTTHKKCGIPSPYEKLRKASLWD
jgi:hypothetical protein